MYIPQIDINQALIIIKYFIPAFCIMFIFLNFIVCKRIEKYLNAKILNDQILEEQYSMLTVKHKQMQSEIQKVESLLKFSEIDQYWEEYFKENKKQ